MNLSYLLSALMRISLVAGLASPETGGQAARPHLTPQFGIVLEGAMNLRCPTLKDGEGWNFPTDVLQASIERRDALGMSYSKLYLNSAPLLQKIYRNSSHMNNNLFASDGLTVSLSSKDDQVLRLLIEPYYLRDVAIVEPTSDIPTNVITSSDPLNLITTPLIPFFPELEKDRGQKGLFLQNQFEKIEKRLSLVSHYLFQEFCKSSATNPLGEPVAIPNSKYILPPHNGVRARIIQLPAKDLALDATKNTGEAHTTDWHSIENFLSGKEGLAILDGTQFSDTFVSTANGATVKMELPNDQSPFTFVLYDTKEPRHKMYFNCLETNQTKTVINIKSGAIECHEYLPAFDLIPVTIPAFNDTNPSCGQDIESEAKVYFQKKLKTEDLQVKLQPALACELGEPCRRTCQANVMMQKNSSLNTLYEPGTLALSEQALTFLHNKYLKDLSGDITIEKIRFVSKDIYQLFATIRIWRKNISRNRRPDQFTIYSRLVSRSQLDNSGKFLLSGASSHTLRLTSSNHFAIESLSSPTQWIDYVALKDNDLALKFPQQKLHEQHFLPGGPPNLQSDDSCDRNQLLELEEFFYSLSSCDFQIGSSGLQSEEPLTVKFEDVPNRHLFLFDREERSSSGHTFFRIDTEQFRSDSVGQGEQIALDYFTKNYGGNGQYSKSSLPAPRLVSQPRCPFSGSPPLTFVRDVESDENEIVVHYKTTESLIPARGDETFDFICEPEITVSTGSDTGFAFSCKNNCPMNRMNFFSQ